MVFRHWTHERAAPPPKSQKREDEAKIQMWGETFPIDVCQSEAGMCERRRTGDEEFDRGLCCSSSVERNAAVKSQLQEGACLQMTQSPQLHAPPPSKAKILIKPCEPLHCLCNFQFNHKYPSMLPHCSPQVGWAGRQWQENEGEVNRKSNWWQKWQHLHCSKCNCFIFFLIVNISRGQNPRWETVTLYTNVPQVGIRFMEALSPSAETD